MSDPKADEVAEESAEDIDDEAFDRETLEEFLSQYSGGGYQFPLFRLEPRAAVIRGQSKRLSGHLETFHTLPTLDEIRERFGGGVYELRVMARVGSKGPRILKSRRFEIAGDPRVPGGDDVPPAEPMIIAAPPAPPSPTHDPALVQQIIDDKRRAEDRLERVLTERAQAPSGPDPALLEKTLSAIERSQKDQLDTLRQELTRRDQELAELRQQMETARGRVSPLEHPEVLKVLFGRGPEEAARVTDQARRDLETERERYQREREAERERRERELAAERRDRQLLADETAKAMEQARRDLEMERDRHQREIEAERERRERELAAERRDRELQVAMIERLHKSDVDNLRTAHAQLIATKDEHINRLADEMRTLRSAARPQDTLSDLERMGKVVSAVRTVLPGLAGETLDEPKSGWERILERAAPLVDRVVENASKPAPVTIYQAPIPPSFPARYPAGPRPMIAPSLPRRPNPSVPQPAGTMPRASAASEVGSEGSSVGEGLAFLEAAYRDEQPIDEVARTAKQSFAESDLRALVSAGPEFLAAEIEKRAPDSLLASSGGKRYLRELVEAVKTQLPAT